jgi:hypothetical protein
MNVSPHCLEQSGPVKLMGMRQHASPPRQMAPIPLRTCTTGISKASLEVVIDKYNSYIDQQGVLDAIFDEFDANKSGVLEPNQVPRTLHGLALPDGY